MDDYQTFIAKSRYARWIPESNRRENWPETVQRYIQFWKGKYPEFEGELEEANTAILNMEVMPSMRALATAGPALERDNICGYNCAYTPVDHPKAFSEILYILMNGTGVGFSVEREYTAQLPEVPSELEPVENIIVVQDSKEGWAKGLRTLVSSLYYGEIPKWDLSKLRPAGAVLKTFGGRSSGPDPLNALYSFFVKTFVEAKGRKLTTLEVHDLVCSTASVVIVGGVRRSALISLSSPSDERLRNCKQGNWFYVAPYRSFANNSACYGDTPDVGFFLREWGALYESKSGERGIFSRGAAKRTVEKIGRRSSEWEFGTNPCSEIILRPREFCNLTEAIVRPEDNKETIQRKIEIATFLGTLQATLTNFKFISKKWKDNCEEERLLGVSLTGIMDNPLTYNPAPEMLETWRDAAVATNRYWANRLGINVSSAITCVKPSGTVSQLVGSSSGIHARWSPFYIRRVRNDKRDPVSAFLVDQEIPHEEDVVNPSQWVFSFPQKSPEKAVCRQDVTALTQLSLWKLYSDHWCEHKPSCTIYVKENEWIEVANWVYHNFDALSGISFLPYSDHVYQQAPYEEIPEGSYIGPARPLDWSLLENYEKEDTTTSSQEWACTGDRCEI